jgi:hypothetical protein
MYYKRSVTGQSALWLAIAVRVDKVLVYKGCAFYFQPQASEAKGVELFFLFCYFVTCMTLMNI